MARVAVAGYVGSHSSSIDDGRTSLGRTQQGLPFPRFGAHFGEFFYEGERISVVSFSVPFFLSRVRFRGFHFFESRVSNFLFNFFKDKKHVSSTRVLCTDF